MSRTELAEFLRRRREALRPEDVLTTVSHRRTRRTPGLRREEVAELAGVSTSYYERLEQARGPHPSAQVVIALGLALRLSAPEQEHLARVSGLAPVSRPADPVPEPTAPSGAADMEREPGDAAGLAAGRRLLDGLLSIPAYLVDQRQQIVAWNSAAVALIIDFAQLPAEERNITRLSVRLGDTLCSEPPDSDGEFGRAFAAELRATRARYGFDPVLAEHVNEYAAHSPAFVAAWTNHDVRPRQVIRKRLRHPDLGALELDRHTLLVPGADLRLVIYTADPVSPSGTALAQLVTPS